ncbi:gluconokinase [Polynucleobacter necessarius]|uniref:gluconokinase n=1 Tax=Polynucleobacter necessarius TaxID=576610 RepID=UPI000E09419C|nr:gluconokinase [Polynucleobacter necessarius]
MIYLVMGVSGCGKTTTGLNLASRLDAIFLDADSFHSESNLSKMAKGIPLTDEDREPWLAKLNSKLIKATMNSKNIVLACSALKDSYRKSLLSNIESYLIIYLKADISLLERRQSERKNHFFNPKLLFSQIAILEEPKENFIELDASKSTQDIVEEIFCKLV